MDKGGCTFELRLETSGMNDDVIEGLVFLAWAPGLGGSCRAVRIGHALVQVSFAESYWA
jgi:hypothetical protein